MTTEYTFTLFIAGLDRDDLDSVDRLYEAGLDDALVGCLSRAGRPPMSSTRC